MRQEELFRTQVIATEQTPEISGFSLRRDYIDIEEERCLLEHLESGPWESDWRRRIQQYGLGYGAAGGAPVWLRDFPEWLEPLAARVAKDANFERFPENCVINEYIPPLGIGPHKDYPAFGPTIACVSLGSDVVTDFILPKRANSLSPARGGEGKGEGAHKVSIHVPARSLWVITGEARSQWQHGIASRLNDLIHGERRPRSRRVSITFRTARDPKLVRR